MTYNANTDGVRVTNAAKYPADYLVTNGLNMLVRELVAAGMLTCTVAAVAPAGPVRNDIWFKPDTGLSALAAPVGDAVIYRWDGVVWQVMTPLQFATYISILAGSEAASQAEVNAGVLATKYVSPLTCKNVPKSLEYGLYSGTSFAGMAANTYYAVTLTPVSFSNNAAAFWTPGAAFLTIGVAGVYQFSFSGQVDIQTSGAATIAGVTGLSVNGGLVNYATDTMSHLGAATSGLQTSISGAHYLNPGDVVRFLARAAASANFVTANYTAFGQASIIRLG